MTKGSWDWAIGVLRGVVIDCEGRLPTADMTTIWQFIDVGEPGLALETLCTQLDENEVPVSGETLERLSELRAYYADAD
jgi:hypothetical protein